MLLEKIQDRIAIVYGRFQPLTKAHYRMIKTLIERYQQVFVFPVQGPKAFKILAKTPKGQASEKARKMGKSPFPVGLRAELIAKAFPNLPNKNIMKLEAGSITAALSAIKRVYPKTNISKVDVWAGPDEYESYKNQLNYIENPEGIKVLEFDVGEREDISATKLRKALIDDDFKAYEHLVAPPLADEATYNRLRRVLRKAQGLEENMLYLLNFLGEEILFEKKKSEFQKLQDNKIPLTPEERKECMDKKAIWNFHIGKDGKHHPSPAVWKAKDAEGKIWYITNTHRAWQKRPTLKGAISIYHRFIKGTA